MRLIASRSSLDLQRRPEVFPCNCSNVLEMFCKELFFLFWIYREYLFVFKKVYIHIVPNSKGTWGIFYVPFLFSLFYSLLSIIHFSQEK